MVKIRLLENVENVGEYGEDVSVAPDVAKKLIEDGKAKEVNKKK